MLVLVLSAFDAILILTYLSDVSNPCSVFIRCSKLKSLPEFVCHLTEQSRHMWGFWCPCVGTVACGPLGFRQLEWWWLWQSGDAELLALSSSDCCHGVTGLCMLPVKVLVTQLCLTVCNSITVARWAPLSMEFCRQEYWSGLPFPSPGDFLI